MKHVKPWHICVLAAAMLVALAAPAAAASSDPEHDYGQQTPYGDPGETSVEAPPDGFTMFFLQNLGRHGARSLTSDDTEDDALDVWKDAQEADALTNVGRTFARDVKRFQQAEEKIGYGKLSGLGREEWQGIGRRTAETYRDFFQSVAQEDEKIATFTTESTRTKQSAAALHDGLSGAESDLDLGDLLEPLQEAEKLLRFSNDPSEAGKEKTSEALDRDTVRRHAAHLLRTLYTDEFVDDIDDPVDAALDVHKLYATAAGMTKDTDVTFERYMPQDDRARLAYAGDAEKFFKYGPGVEGETVTFDDARPILADFFDRIDQRVDGSSTAAVLRMAHGETTMPFAALIEAPGSRVQVPEGDPFTRTGNPWRGAVAGRLAGNIEWTSFRNDNRTVLVTMRYNEKPARFHDDCVAYEPDGYFYTAAELERCLG